MVTLLTLVLVAVVSPFAPSTPLLSKELPLAEHQEILFEIPALGFYHIEATSGRGVALTISDRMAGPIARHGVVGYLDGKTNLVLDAGSYKAYLEGPAGIQGTVKFEVKPAATDAGDIPRLDALRLVETELGETEQRSFWLILPEDEDVVLQIMGRHLEEVKLWSPGYWQVDLSQAKVYTHYPKPGQPMKQVLYYGRLPAGQYLLTCHGGAGEPWTEEGSKPLYLRRGLPTMGANGFEQFAISPMGIDFFTYSDKADYFQFQREGATDLTMQFRPLGPDSFSTSHTWQSIYRTENDARDVRLREPYVDQPGLLQIEGPPGTKVQFTYLDTTPPQPTQGNHLIVTHPNLTRQDQFEATGGFADNQQWTAFTAAPLSASQSVARQTNLTEPLALVIQAWDQGTYTVSESEGGAKAWYRILPMVLQDPAKAPAFEPPGTPILIAPGYYRLEIEPRVQGILNFSLANTGDTKPPVFLGPDQVSQSLLWNINISNQGFIGMSNLDFAETGFSFRALPLDLKDPLSFNLEPGSVVEFSVTTEKERFLPVGDRLEYLLDGQPLEPNQVLFPGTHQLKVKNPSSKRARTRLRTQMATPDLPLIPLESWAHPADLYPVLPPGQTVFADYAAGVPTSMLLNVPESGLYRIETTGRLATELRVRTRTQPKLFYGRQNGVGRNGLVQQYLREGAYQTTVVTQGTSAGRAGLLMNRMTVLEGQPLAVGHPRSIALPPDTAMRLPLVISEPGRYQIGTAGLGHAPPIRIEDPDGFPLCKPLQGTIDFALNPGTYQIIALPETVPNRRVITVDLLDQKLTREGKGPHPIAFNETVSHIWQLGEPDQYTLDVPATVEAEITLQTGMAADLVDPEGTRWGIVGGTLWRGTLVQGPLSLAVRRLDDDQFYPYSLTVQTKTLLANAPQVVATFPCTLPVKIGTAGLVDLFSLGGLDLRAELRNHQGQLVAQNDDSDTNWNFQISQPLEPGAYNLHLDVRNKVEGGTSQIALLHRTPQRLAELQLPQRQTLQPGSHVLELPFHQTAQGLVRFQAKSNAQVTLALSNDAVPMGTAQNQLLAALEPGTYLLKVWFPTAQDAEVDLQAELLPLKSTLMSASDTFKPDVAYALNDPKSRLWQTQTNAVHFAERTGQVLQPSSSGQVSMYQGSGWLVVQTDTRFEPISFTSQTRVDLAELSGPTQLEIQHQTDGPCLVRIEASNQQPAAMLGSAPLGQFSWDQHVRAANGTLFGLPNRGTYPIRLWPLGPNHPTGSLRLSATTYPTARAVAFAPSQATLAASQTHTIDLNGLPAVEVTLSKGLVALFAKDNQAYALRAATHTNGTFRVTAQGGTVTLINTGTTEGTWRIDRARGDQLIQPENTLERFFPTSTAFQYEWHAAAHPVWVEAPGVDLTWYGADGQYQEATGSLNLAGGPGTLVGKGGPSHLWISATPEADRETRFVLSQTRQDPTPWTTEPEQVSGGIRRPLVLDQPTWLDITTGGPSLLALLQDGKVVARTTQLENGLFSRLVPAGTYEFVYRPLSQNTAAQPFSLKKLPIQTFDPKSPPGPRLLREQERHVWQFPVTAQGRVGVGAQVDGDRITARLYDSQQNLVGSGPYLLRDLQPGTYYLTFSTWGAPVQYQPLVYGSQGPLADIPPETIQSYLNPNETPNPNTNEQQFNEGEEAP